MPWSLAELLAENFGVAVLQKDRWIAVVIPGGNAPRFCQRNLSGFS